jgi:hypothetical protein
VVLWQAACRDGVGGQDRERIEAHTDQNIVETIDWEFQPAKGVLDSNFPCRDPLTKTWLSGEATATRVCGSSWNGFDTAQTKP